MKERISQIEYYYTDKDCYYCMEYWNGKTSRFTIGDFFDYFTEDGHEDIRDVVWMSYKNFVDHMNDINIDLGLTADPMYNWHTDDAEYRSGK